MKRFLQFFSVVLMCACCFGGMEAQAAGKKGVIENGIYADDIHLGGLTSSQAVEVITAYVDELKQKEVSLLAADDHVIVVTAEELGLRWGNPDLVKEAMSFGVSGNIIERYKAKKDLLQSNQRLEVKLSVNEGNIRNIIEEQCSIYDQEPVEASLSREDGEFVLVSGENGYALDLDSSTARVVEALLGDWNHENVEVEMDIQVSFPVHPTEELAQVKDVLGTYTTSFSGSAAGRVANVSNGCSKVNGITVYPGEVVSVHDLMAPYTTKNGYDLAGAYMSGRVVDVVGGGVCQVSTTLYNAVLLAELEVVERHNHSMTVSYVPVSADAAMAESAGKDFQFANNTEYPIYIEGYTTPNKKITFTIYGKETRDPSRKVRYQSEVLEVIPPAADVIYTDGSQPVGYIVTEGSHTGYKGKLWKIVTIDGVDQPKEQVNASSYKQSPRMATVGTATDDPVAYEQIMAAIASGSIDTVKATIGAIRANAAAAAAQ